jgi:hypothetical protein
MTRHNPILAKKRGSKFYNGAFAGVLLLVTCRNQFSRRKNLPNNNGETQLIPTGVIDQKIAGLLTTGHLLLPNEPRRGASSLPFSQPNSAFLARKPTDSAGGVRQTQVAESHVSMSSHGNFVPSGAPPTADKNIQLTSTIWKHSRQQKSEA